MGVYEASYYYDDAEKVWWLVGGSALGFGVDGKWGTRWCTGCGVCCAAARARAFLGGIHRRQRLGILEQLIEIEKESSV